MRKTWETIKQLLNKNYKQFEFPSTFKINGVNISDKKEIAQQFNNFFVNIGGKLAETILPKHQTKPFDSYLKDRCNSTFNFVPVTRDEVISVIHNFAPKKSAGHDLISTHLLKEISLLIADYANYVTAVRHVKNLGVYLDRHLDMTTQVSRTISTCSLHMRNIAQIRRYLTRPTTERVVNALITSRLDYCNSLLFGTSASNINRLQRLQNSVARLVTRQARRDSAMPLLRELHWLPVHHRVTYKIAELTFKALHVDLSPTYLQQFVQVYTPARSLRSACSYTLVANRSRTVAGDCTFVHAAATVWNALPVSVTSKDSLLSFKAALKTHLCALAYT